MPDLPDAWPPVAPPTMIVPVFPLKNTWLYPRTILPLHIFEPRYRQMIEDSLDGPGRLVVGTIVEGHDASASGAPPFYSVAGLGELASHEKLEDGRFNILLAGLCRVRAEEVPSDRLYRKVRVEPVVETIPPDDTEGPLRDELRRAVEYMDRDGDLKPNALDMLTVGPLTDVLSAQIDVERPLRQEIFETLDVLDRARRALAAFEAERRRRELEGDAGDEA